MILHVNFTDGSNPWVCFSDDRREIAEHWRDWIKYHMEEAQPKAYAGNYICERSNDNAGFILYKRGEYRDTIKHYKHLGHALAALDRLGGENV